MEQKAREKDEESDDFDTKKVIEDLDGIVKSLMPYHRPIMIGGSIILILLVVFLGFALGGLKVCSDLDGLLDDRFECHPGFFADQNQFNQVGMPFKIPNLTTINEMTLEDGT